MKKAWKAIAIVLPIALTAGVAVLFFLRALPFQRPDRSAYPVRGVDVSSYQGAIDWEVLSRQDVAFAFIKATEGSSLVDPFFADNWLGASETGLRIGAYHFFSFETPGAAQAAHFIETVERTAGMLPPVIDVEFYGSFSPSGVDPDALRKELRDLVDALTDRYAVKPILYVTEESQKALIGDRFDDCELWIRSVWLGKPIGRFTFWQYSDRAVLNGYRGKERCIDLNVFNGSEAEWAAYPGVPEP